MNQITFRTLGVTGLWNSRFIIFNDRVRGIHDDLRRTVVPLQTEQLAIGIILLEIQDILDFGSSESID